MELPINLWNIIKEQLNWKCIWSIAINNKHMDVIKFLHIEDIYSDHVNEKYTLGCTTDAMDDASRNGNLDIVKYLDENRNEGCTTDAMDNAAKNGHFDIVRYLHENMKGCTTDAMDNAAKNGHFDIVKYLHIVKYLRENMKGCTKKALYWSYMNGHSEIEKFIEDNYNFEIARIYELCKDDFPSVDFDEFPHPSFKSHCKYLNIPDNEKDYSSRECLSIYNKACGPLIKKVLSIMTDVVKRKFNNVKCGDIIELDWLSGYRNDGRYIYSGNEVEELARCFDDYGHLPRYYTSPDKVPFSHYDLGQIDHNSVQYLSEDAKTQIAENIQDEPLLDSSGEEISPFYSKFFGRLFVPDNMYDNVQDWKEDIKNCKYIVEWHNGVVYYRDTNHPKVKIRMYLV